METIFESPALDETDYRVSWMHTETEEDTLVETNLDHLFDPQDTLHQEWLPLS